MPEINLIPMMDVLMTILTFFIILSMTAQFDQQALNVNLPQADTGVDSTRYTDPFIVGLDRQGQISLNHQPVNPQQLNQQMQAYLNQHPSGAVILKADYQLTYQQIVNVLGPMRDIGGDRVSLAVN